MNFNIFYVVFFFLWENVTVHWTLSTYIQCIRCMVNWSLNMKPKTNVSFLSSFFPFNFQARFASASDCGFPFIQKIPFTKFFTSVVSPYFCFLLQISCFFGNGLLLENNIVSVFLFRSYFLSRVSTEWVTSHALHLTIECGISLHWSTQLLLCYRQLLLPIQKDTWHFSSCILHSNCIMLQKTKMYLFLLWHYDSFPFIVFFCAQFREVKNSAEEGEKKSGTKLNRISTLVEKCTTFPIYYSIQLFLTILYIFFVLPFLFILSSVI